MFCKLVTVAFVGLLSISACAKPNYLNVSGTAEQDAQSAGSRTCVLSLPIQGLCVDLVWETKPTESTMGSFFISFYTKDNSINLIEPNYAVAVILWMPSMGHGSSPVQMQKIENGHYRVSNVFFVMPGDWDIRIQLKDGKNVVEEVIQPISI